VRRALLLAAVVGAALSVAEPASAQVPGAAPYGLVASNGNFVPGATVAERSASYRRLYDAGVRAIRVDINWVQVDPPGSPLGVFDFADRDREVKAITDAGLKIIGILAYGHPDYSKLGTFVGATPVTGGLPPFAVGSAQYYPPDDPADFARYAQATVARYRTQAVAWEVWNEQNEGWRFWPPHEDPAAYARLLCTTYAAVKGVAPHAPVLYGGVFFPAVAGLPGTSGPDFVQETYDVHPGLGRCYDAMAYHPYPYPFTAPELDVPVRGSVLAAADQMRAVLARNGDRAKPLWITEVGWPTNSNAYGVGEEKQAQYVARMQAATFSQGLPVLTWYTYGDDHDPTGANQEAAFGFFRADGSQKPSYRALRTFAHVFAGTRFTADRSRQLGLPAGAMFSGGRGFALQYHRSGATITALWLATESVAEGQGSSPLGGSAGPSSAAVHLPVSAPRVSVVDYLGATRTASATRGAVDLTVGPAPIYVVDASAVGSHTKVSRVKRKRQRRRHRRPRRPR
jgi:polysaccharide biosynthesis protein PslG